MDTAVAVLALIAVGAAMPPESLTTSFYWAGSYAGAVALMLGLSLPPEAGGLGLAVLIGVYGLTVDVGAGPQALAVAGNAAGIAVYFGYGVLAAWHARRLTGVAARAEEDALSRQALLGVQQARLEEFGRLHDEAVQVLEQVDVTDEAGAAPLRAYAAMAASHLRTAIEDHRPAGNSVAEALRNVADGFAALRFGVTVDCATPLPDPGLRATGKLAAAVTEALNNAYKHSGTAHAWVRAAAAHGGIEVSVEDKGAGFPAEAAGAGFGITNCIRRRLEEAGGSAEFQSAPGAGTTVRMWLPC